jgi:RNA polymerase sigma-70 factor (ECF subfamily)
MAADDLELVQAMATGDAGALSSFYDRHSGIVFATCLRMLGDRATAEELLIDIFHEFWQRAGQYDASRGNPLTFLLTLTRSRAIDKRRTIGKKSAVRLVSDEAAEPAADSHADALTNLITSENAEKIRSALAVLEPEQKRAIELAYYDGMSHSEVAEALKKPLGTVKTYIRQGLIRLREGLRTDLESVEKP